MTTSRVGGFVEHDFANGWRDDLRALPAQPRQSIVDKSGAGEANFKMRVGFVEQENRLRIRVKVSEQQECLLQAATRTRKVKQTPLPRSW